MFPIGPVFQLANSPNAGPYTGIGLVNNLGATQAAGPAATFTLSLPANTTAGVVFAFTVTAIDIHSLTATSYTGTVTFSSNDPLATLPANGTLVNGVGVFSATLFSTASQTITATDTVTSTITGHASATVAAISPSSIAGLAAWYKADAQVYNTGTTPATNGQTISQWTDQSSTGANLLPATSGNQPGATAPTLATNKYNGLPCVQFASNGSTTSTCLAYTFGAAPVQPLTVFMVANTGYPLTTSGQFILSTCDITSTAASGTLGGMGMYGGSSLAGTWPLITDHEASTYMLAMNGNPSTISVEGTQILTGNPGSSYSTTSLELGTNLGGNYAYGQTFDACEICLYSVTLSTVNQRCIQAYLQGRWKTRPALPSTGNLAFYGFQRTALAGGGTNDQNACLMTSVDSGASWQQQRIFYQPNDGWNTVRDPSVITPAQSGNGYYWMVHTRCNNGLKAQNIVLARSLDGITWSHFGYIDLSSVAVSANYYCWAPEWFIDSDNSVHIIVTIGPSSTGLLQPYEVHPGDGPFTIASWSAPTAITGTAIPNSSIGVYDLFEIKVASTYYLFLHNQSNNLIEVYSSTSPFSGFNTAFRTGTWFGTVTGDNCEGPCIKQVGSNWYLTYDSNNPATNVVTQPVGATDWTGTNAASWTARAAFNITMGPPGVKQGTVVFTP